MNSKATETLYQQRLKVVRLFDKGHKIMHIVKESGFSYPTVRSILDRYQEGGVEALRPRARGRRVGSGRSLTKVQEQAIKKLLQESIPAEHGLDYDQWSRSAVAALIQKELDISITARGVGNYLNRWNIQPLKNTTKAKSNRQSSALSVGEANPKDATEMGGLNFPSWGPLDTLHGDSPQTLAGKTALRIKRDIITHQLTPGERLTFDKLAQRYQVGSSSLREALFQMVGQGLVVSEEHRGFLVSPINIDEMKDISSLRSQLEALALRQSIERGDELWEAEIISANHLLKRATAALNQASGEASIEQIELWEERHRELHTTLCRACGSPWLLYFIGILYEHLERYRRFFWDYTQRAQGADDEHEDIVNAVLDRDVERAVALLNQHFSTQAELSMMAAEKADAAEQTPANNS